MGPKGPTVSYLDIRVVSLGIIVAPNLEVVILRVGNHCVNYISLKVSLVDQFRKHCKLRTKVSLMLLITLVMVVVVSL